jgi:EGF-like domain/Laminin EGF domain
VQVNRRWSSGWLTALVTVTVALAGCDDAGTRATLVTPVFGDPCLYASCSAHGMCVAAAGGGPSCLCEVGYAGPRCDDCEAGFHLDAKQRCVPDKLCALQDPNPCAPYGSCYDSDGVIACRCDVGYEGPRCTLCQSGYGRNEFGECLQLVLGAGGSAGGPSVLLGGESAPHGAGAAPEPTPTENEPTDASLPDAAADGCAGGSRADGAACGGCLTGYYLPYLSNTCVPLDCRSNPIKGPATVAFDGDASYPTADSTCFQSKAQQVDSLTVTSIGGDGTVWTCAPSAWVHFSTNHVLVEAGAQFPGRLTFAGPVTKLSFEYGAYSALDLSLLADGVPVGTLAATNRATGSQSFTFATPITVFELLSKNASTNHIALDNVVFEPPACP